MGVLPIEIFRFWVIGNPRKDGPMVRFSLFHNRIPTLNIKQKTKHLVNIEVILTLVQGLSAS